MSATVPLALGFPISAEATPDVAGTIGFFIAEGGDSNRLLITARHVVIPLKETSVKFERENESQLHSNISLLGDKAYESCLASIKARIEGHAVIADNAKLRLNGVEGQDSKAANKERKWVQDKMRNETERNSTPSATTSTRTGPPTPTTSWGT